MKLAEPAGGEQGGAMLVPMAGGCPGGGGLWAAWPLSTECAAPVSVPVGCAGKLEQERT